MLNYHRERFRKLTFRALALRQSDGCFERLNAMQSSLSCQSGIDPGPFRLGHETNGAEYFVSLDINEKPSFCKEKKKKSKEGFCRIVDLHTN